MTTPGGNTELGRALDELSARFSDGAYHEEIVAAREQFMARTGEVFEEDDLFESRTASFLEWYALERPLSMHAVTPVAVALRGASEPERELLEALDRSYRSLFSIHLNARGPNKEEGVRLEDLCGGCHFHVDERRRLHGVDTGDLVEARLIPWRGRLVFGRGFLYHPGAARAAIFEHVRRGLAEGVSRPDLVDQVAALRIRAERYKHVAPESVYALPVRSA